MTKYVIRDERGVGIAKIGEYQYQQIPTLKPSEVIIDCNNVTFRVLDICRGRSTQ